MVKIKKTWETVFFTATKGDTEETIELNMNNEDKTYTLCNGNEESVSFENKDQLELSLIMEALRAAQKYMIEHLFKEFFEERGGKC